MALGEQLTPSRGGTLEFAVLVEPSNYDCHSNISFAFLHPVAPHYSTLLKFDSANYPQIVGDLAESWTVSPDHLTYTFKLRPDVLFHDGSPLTSTDVKASYERIIHPPPGVVSARKVDYAAIVSIDIPDPHTLVFHLLWPDAAMLANFASPWNCIYSAAKLAEDPQFPKTHVLGTGPFVFAEHAKGQYWRGSRWDKYFLPGKPYLDGYRADFMTGPAVMEAYKTGRIAAEFRGITPIQRDQLQEALGDRIEVSESSWLSNLLVVFNTHRAPFDDDRVRRALSLAIDRWGAAAKLQNSTFLKYVGGVMRPGSSMATPESELVTLPGFSHDLSPVNYSGSTDRFLDALFIGQAVTSDPRQRAKIARDFERHALTEAYTVPLLWWNRIVATSSALNGWSITPSHFIGQDLTDVWLSAPQSAGAANVQK